LFLKKLDARLGAKKFRAQGYTGRGCPESGRFDLLNKLDAAGGLNSYTVILQYAAERFLWHCDNLESWSAFLRIFSTIEVNTYRH